MRTTLSIRFAFVAFFMLTIVSAASAQSASMSKFEALYVYNFAKSVSHVEKTDNSAIVITVLGDLQLQNELTNIARSKVGGRKVYVRGASSVAQLPISNVIVVGKSMTNKIPELVVNQGEKALIVSTEKGLCSNGAAISLYADNGKLTYEICKKNLRRAGLYAPQHLISLGIEVF